MPAAVAYVLLLARHDLASRWLIVAAIVAVIVLAAVLVWARPRPTSSLTSPLFSQRQRTDAVKVVRRGAPIAPPERQALAIDDLRRQWWSAMLGPSIWPMLAVTWALQPVRGGLDIAGRVLGGVLLASSLAGLLALRRWMRRVDALEDQTLRDGDQATSAAATPRDDEGT